MLTDIRSVLMENKTNAEETVYAELPKAITEYPLTIGDQYRDFRTGNGGTVFGIIGQQNPFFYKA